MRICFICKNSVNPDDYEILIKQSKKIIWKDGKKGFTEENKMLVVCDKCWYKTKEFREFEILFEGKAKILTSRVKLPEER